MPAMSPFTPPLGKAFPLIGGFVDWTQKLLGNNKERLLISGFGLSLLDKSE